MQTKLFQLAALCLIPGCLLAAEPRVIAPFDGSPALFDGSGKPIGIAALAGAGPAIPAAWTARLLRCAGLHTTR